MCEGMLNFWHLDVENSNEYFVITKQKINHLFLVKQVEA